MNLRTDVTYLLVAVIAAAASTFCGAETLEDSQKSQKRMYPFMPTVGFENSLTMLDEPLFLDSEDLYRDIKRADITDVPGILRFGKRSQFSPRFESDEFTRLVEKNIDDNNLKNEKKNVPGVLRFGKRSDMPGVLRFGKKRAFEDGSIDMPGVLRFGKRGDMPGVLRFGKRGDMPGVLRFGKRASAFENGGMPGVLRFGKRFEVTYLDKKNGIPRMLRFGKK